MAIGPDWSAHHRAVASAIEDAALCSRCVAAKTGLALSDLAETILGLVRIRAVKRHLAPCQACGRDTLLYRLAERQVGDK